MMGKGTKHIETVSMSSMIFIGICSMFLYVSEKCIIKVLPAYTNIIYIIYKYTSLVILFPVKKLGDFLASFFLDLKREVPGRLFLRTCILESLTC